MPAPVPAPVTTASGIRRATIARFTCTFPRSISAFITTTSRSPSSQTTLRTFGTLFSLDMRHGCHRTPILAARPSLPPPISSTTAILLHGRHFPTPRRRLRVSPSPSAITKIPSSSPLPSPTDAARPRNPLPAVSAALSRRIASSRW